MNNTIFYLIGHSDVARGDMARQIATLSGARIVDARAIYEPIFNVVAHEHPADMPDGVWDQVDAVRNAILTTIETMAPADWSFVFTHAGFDIPADVGVYRRVRETARKRKARFLPVTLNGGASKRALLRFDEADALTVDLAAMTPAAAARIVAAAGG